MSDFYNFGLQLRELLKGLLHTEPQVPETFISKSLPLEGADEIHPETSMVVDIFGQGTEKIVFPPENVTLKIKRGQPFKARNGLTTIETEMVELNLKGESKLLGSLTLKGGAEVVQDPNRKITGKIIETEPGVGLPADNYFDVLLEIETEHGVFFNKKPEHMVATITDIPPNFAKTPYFSTTEINLYSKLNPDGPPVGVIREVAHKD
ncbi:MAG TPA: hypothetical protein VJ843_00390 [Candidatus Saccharimonadales bacterium]|nr:hypothetical protein [Candidatus Saccharimonadales bacterium]